MFPNLFTPSPIAWAALIGTMVALPVLIHLINLFRHRRVKWAAMDFLLQSYKRQRNWIRLKQFLLLLARIAALLLATFMLAQVGCDNEQISGMLGGRTIHHYVLVDDSYSMSAEAAGRSAVLRARDALQVLGQRFGRGVDRRVTLVRFSAALPSEQAAQADLALEQLTDLNGVRVDSRFGEVWDARVTPLAATPLSVGPLNALSLVRQLIEERTEENAVVHVLSDFRAKEWGSANTTNPSPQATPAPTAEPAQAPSSSSAAASEVAQQLAEIAAAGAAIDLIRCAPDSEINLGIASLEVVGNIRAAGVPVMMRVTISNHSDQVARNVTARVFSRAYSLDAAQRGDATTQSPLNELPTVFIETIEANGSAVREFPVFFSLPGLHEVQVQLGNDALAEDNQRFAVLDASPGTQALLVDGGDDSGANYLSLIFRPGRAQSGVVPVIRSADSLRDLSLADLAQFDTVYLLGVSRLEPAVVDKLELFVDQGGGIAWFVDERTDLEYFNATLHKNGEGLFGLPIERIETTPTFNDGELPDIVPTEHPLLAPFRNRNDSLLALVQVSKFAVPPISWDAADDNQLEVIAEVRGDRRWPLIVEKRFGAGRSVLVTSSAGQSWNNWQRNPTFPVLILGLQERLAAGRRPSADTRVGQSLPLQLPTEEFRANVTFEIPTSDPDSNMIVEREARRVEAAADSWLTGIGPNFAGAIDVNETWQPGVYTSWARRLNGDLIASRWALNVDPDEGDLKTPTQRELMDLVSSDQVNVIDWDDLSPNPERESGALIGRWILPLLILLLIGEQLLAYTISYHPGRAAVVRPGGAR